MNSIERIMTAVRFGKPDRTPVIPQIFAHSAVIAGYNILDYVQDGTLAADCQIEALRRYGQDSVFAAIDVCIEAEAIGAELRFRQDIYPAVVTPPLTAESDFANLPLPDPTKAARMPELLTMARILRGKVGHDSMVVGILQGPMTLAVQFLGMEKALYLAADNPDRFELLLDYCTQFAICFGLAQLEAGVHLPMVFEPAGCPEVVPAAFFREFLAPRLSLIFAAFKKAGALANWLHIAGRTQSILPLYSGIGIDIGNFDYCVDPQYISRNLPDQLCVDGNIMPMAFIQDQPEQIMTESRRLINCFGNRGGFILSSGCEIPPESKPENIEAMIAATRIDLAPHTAN